MFRLLAAAAPQHWCWLCCRSGSVRIRIILRNPRMHRNGSGSISYLMSTTKLTGSENLTKLPSSWVLVYQLTRKIKLGRKKSTVLGILPLWNDKSEKGSVFGFILKCKTWSKSVSKWSGSAILRTSNLQRWERATFFWVRNRNSATCRKHFRNRNSATF